MARMLRSKDARLWSRTLANYIATQGGQGLGDRGKKQLLNGSYDGLVKRLVGPSCTMRPARL